MKVQIISDLHLNDYKFQDKIISFEDIIKPNSKYLFLAGDLCPLDCKYLKPFLNYYSVKKLEKSILCILIMNIINIIKINNVTII